MIIDTQEGRRHAIGILIGAVQSFTKDGLLRDTVQHLRESADRHQNIDYRAGVLEVVGMVEGRLNERA